MDKFEVDLHSGRPGPAFLPCRFEIRGAGGFKHSCTGDRGDMISRGDQGWSICLVALHHLQPRTCRPDQSLIRPISSQWSRYCPSLLSSCIRSHQVLPDLHTSCPPCPASRAFRRQVAGLVEIRVKQQLTVPHRTSLSPDQATQPVDFLPPASPRPGVCSLVMAVAVA